MSISTIVITGASSGLGKRIAALLARDERWQVVLACRSTDRAEAARAEIARSSCHPVLVAPLELASLASIRAFPEALAALGAAPLGGLVCNAGVQDVSGMQRTVDGFERTFGVNHLGHFALTEVLLDCFERGARIVVVSSNTHDPGTKTGMPAPQYRDAHALAQGVDGGSDAMAAGKIRYTTSKLCNVYFARELAMRLRASPDPRLRSLRVAAFDPGMMPGTGLARGYGAPARLAWTYLLPVLTLGCWNVNTVGRSAQRLALLVADTSPGWPSGAYFSGGVVTAVSEEARDDRRARELWEASAALARRGMPVG